MFLSIIIPAYNKETQIARLLDSIVNSTVFDESIEILVIDDASTDNTVEIVKSYQKQHSNLTLIKHEKNMRVAEARNTGISHANGEWIAFIDGDDYLTENGLEVVVKELHSKHDKGIVFFTYKTSDTLERTGLKQNKCYSLDNIYYDDIFRYVKGCFPVVKRSILNHFTIRFYAQNMDAFFYRKVQMHSPDQKLCFVDQVVGVYDRTTEHSLSKIRSITTYKLYISDIKFKKTIDFLNDMEPYFAENHAIACRYLDDLFIDFRFTSRKMNKVFEIFPFFVQYRYFHAIKYFLWAIFPQKLIVKLKSLQVKMKNGD